MAELLYRLGLGAARHARLVVVAWLVALLTAGGAYALFGGTLTDSFDIPGTPTQEVSDRLRDELPEAAGGTGSVVVQTADGSAFTAAQESAVADMIATAAQVPGVETVVDPFATQAEREAARAQVEGGRAQLEQGRAELDAGAQEIAAGEEQIEAGRLQLEAAEEQIAAARAQAEAAGALDQVRPQLDAQLAEVQAQRAALEAQAEQLAEGKRQIEAGRAELETQAARLEDGAALLETSAGFSTVSDDGSTALVTVVFEESAFVVDKETQEAVLAAFTVPADSAEGVVVDFGADLSTGAPEVFGVAEVIGLLVAAIVLVVMLGTLVAAGLPLLTALIGVGIGALGALGFSGVVQMASMTPVLGLMLGLAVGIDYSLFIVNRHRRQLRTGYSVHESVGLANGTSGNAVVFAGATVLIALLALNLTGIPFLGLMGTVAAACVAIAVLIAVTLTPALLALAGKRVLRPRERAALHAADVDTHGDIHPVADPHLPTRPMSTGGAALRVLGGVVALLVLAIPAVDLRLGLPDGSSQATDSTQYRAYTTVAERFGEGRNGSLLVVADLPATQDENELIGLQADVAQQLAGYDDVVAVVPVGTSEDRRTAAFQVIPVEGPLSESTEDLVTTLREASPLDGDIAIGVAGQASGSIDVSQRLDAALPGYLGVVVGLSLVILVLVFRSLLVPLVATAGFVLSFLGALGGVVAIYQWGWLGPVFGVDNPGPVLSFLPTLLVGILFGLAMDYMLFIGSGIRESYAHGVPARLAVTQGLHAGRAVVTAAAIIMASVFGGFIFAHDAMIRPIGFALALGVLLDAFVVRMLVVPGFLHLVGEKAWWLPRWLDRVLPSVDVEGAALERRHPHHVPEETEVPGQVSTAGRR